MDLYYLDLNTAIIINNKLNSRGANTFTIIIIELIIMKIVIIIIMIIIIRKVAFK